MKTSVIEPWKTIELGQGLQDEADYRQSIIETAIRVHADVSRAFADPKFSIHRHPRKLPLMAVTPEDLGFTDGAVFGELVGRAFEMGLTRCPHDTGPQLRRQYLEQPHGEEIIVATERLKESTYCEWLIYHNRYSTGRGDTGLWLTFEMVNPMFTYIGNLTYFIFTPRNP